MLMSNAKKTLNVITFIGRLISHPNMGFIMSGIAHVVEHHTYYLNVISSYQNEEHYPEFERIISSLTSNVRGAIIYLGGGEVYRKLCLRLQERHIPIVLVERQHLGVAADRVVFNDEEAAFSLTSRLIEQGHTRIAVIVPQFEMMSSTIRHRLLGFRRALSEHHLTYGEDLIWTDMDVAYYL